MIFPEPTAVELVDIAAATYSNAKPEFQDDKHAIRVFVFKTRSGLPVIAIEGTHDLLGWLIDFFALTVKDQQGIDHQSLGMIHGGFYEAAVAALTRCLLIAQEGPYAICGHSLGAALALLLGALLAELGHPPVKIGAFAPPRVGSLRFVKAVTKIPLFACRYGNDPVPLVPFRLGLRGLRFQQVPLTPIGHNMWWPPSCHHINNYVQGVRALNGAR